MSTAKIKGSLLEFIIRRLLTNCGFTRVKPDGLLIFDRGGLTMVNGKGAAHDADVLMNPPIQMPFSYPYRLNFECKAYGKSVGLPVIRNALGLRYDLNDFEIVTKENLDARKNNRRSSLAIDDRQRYNYQIGVACVEKYSKPALEFAANNKIPLISLRWFLPDDVCDKFQLITDGYLKAFSKKQVSELLSFLKGNDNEEGKKFINNVESLFKDIFTSVKEFEKNVFVGLLESGDLLFLFAGSDNARRYIVEREGVLKARFHYVKKELDYWTLSLDEGIGSDGVNFSFYLPETIMKRWGRQNYDKQTAIDLKNEMFSKIFIFVKGREIPFRIVSIDKEWFNEINNNEVQGD